MANPNAKLYIRKEICCNNENWKAGDIVPFVITVGYEFDSPATTVFTLVDTHSSVGNLNQNYIDLSSVKIYFEPYAALTVSYSIDPGSGALIADVRDVMPINVKMILKYNFILSPQEYGSQTNIAQLLTIIDDQQIDFRETRLTFAIDSPKPVITKSADKYIVNLGDTVVWTIDYSNNGNSNAVNTSIVEQIPSWVTPVAFANPGWTPGLTNEYVFTDATPLAPGEHRIAKFVYKVTGPVPVDVTIVPNTAILIVYDYENHQFTDSTTESIFIDPTINFCLTKKLIYGCPNPGAVLIYSINVTNKGNLPVHGPLTLLDLLPVVTIFNAPSSDSGWTPVNSYDYTYLVVNADDVILAGETRTVRISICLKPNMACCGSSIVNKVQLIMREIILEEAESTICLDKPSSCCKCLNNSKCSKC